MQRQLESMLGRTVDSVTQTSVESSPNWIRREAILRPAHRFNVRSKWRRSSKPTSPLIWVMLRWGFSTKSRQAFSMRTAARKGLKLTS